jgi:hypothetical protein
MIQRFILIGVVLGTFTAGCSAVPDPLENYCLGWTTSMDPFKSRDLVNSSIDMMKQTPNTPVLGMRGLTYKDWVEFHELMMSGDRSLDEAKQISELLSGICVEVLK